MKYMQLLRSVLCFVLIAVFSLNAKIIQSTTSGGDWNNPNTWIGNTVPGFMDSVFINGSVGVDDGNGCFFLKVNPSGILKPVSDLSVALQVVESVSNFGSITSYDQSGSGSLVSIVIGKDVKNKGNWVTESLDLVGMNSHSFQLCNTGTFSSAQLTNIFPGSDLVVDSCAVFKNSNIMFANNKLVIPQDCQVEFDNTLMEGVSIIANRSPIKFRNNSGLMNSTFQNAVLKGTVLIGPNVWFEGSVSIEDTLQCLLDMPIQVFVAGSITNNGVIKTYADNDQGSALSLYLNGDIVNNGEWYTSEIYMLDQEIHQIYQSSEAYFRAGLVVLSDSLSSLIAKTDLHFTDTGLWLNGGQLLLSSQKTLSMQNSFIEQARISANHSQIRFRNGSFIQNSTIQNAKLAGEFKISDNVILKGETVLLDTLQSIYNSATILKINGNFVNEGSVQFYQNNPDSAGIEIKLSGNLVNKGVWDCAYSTLEGDTTQSVTIIDNADIYQPVEIFVRVSGIEYQWYKDGQEIDGENGPSLLFNTINDFTTGKYYCLVSDSLGERIFSRTIYVDAGEPTVTGLSDEGAEFSNSFALMQNFPNPFNPITNISFTIPAELHIKFEIFDITGRKIKSLLNKPLQAGTHTYTLDGSDMASGTYFYRISGDGLLMQKKMILLK